MRLVLILLSVALLGVIACDGGAATQEPTLPRFEPPGPSPTSPITLTIAVEPTPIPSLTRLLEPTATQALPPTPTQIPATLPNATIVPTPDPTPTPFLTPTPTPAFWESALWESMYNAEYGYNIDFPSDWAALDNSPDSIIRTDRNTSAVFWVIAMKAFEERPLDAVADTWLLRKEAVPGTLQRHSIVINGVPALRVSYTRVGPTCNEHENIVVVTDGESKLFYLLGTACEEGAEISEEIFEAIQGSFILFDVDANPVDLQAP